MNWLFIPIFIFCWVVSFLLHELGQALEALRQGKNTATIKISKKPPFMYTLAGYLPYRPLYLLAGGGFAGTVMLLVGLISFMLGCFLFTAAFLTMVIVQYLYAIFEVLFIDILSERAYNTYRFILYGMLVVISIAICSISGLI